MLERSRERGDTIIEVLFAVTVFSLIAIGSMSIMNQGMAMAQRSLEIGLVRQQIDEQVDALKFLNEAYVADYGKQGEATARWNTIIRDRAVGTAQNFDAMVAGGSCQLPVSDRDKIFALNINKLEGAGAGAGSVIMPTLDTATYARVRRDQGTTRAEGIWVQAVRLPESTVDASRPGFYDFHIRACWTTPGQAMPMTTGTIVRLYEPRG